MDAMLLLEGPALTSVYAEFRRIYMEHGRGLSLLEFVKSFLENVNTEIDKHALVKLLVDLFQQIDVNGDQTLEWSEFTSFCIEAGMAATAPRIQRPTFFFLYDQRFEDKITRTPVMLQLAYHPVLDVVITIERNSKVLNIYSSKLQLMRTLDSTSSIRKSLRDIDTSVPLRHVLLPPYRMIAVLMSNLAIPLWIITPRSCLYNGTLHRVDAETSPCMLHYDEATKLLLVGCTNGTILGYNPELRKLMLKVRHHSDVILSMCSTPHRACVASSSLDGQVLLWDMERRRVVRVLEKPDGAIEKLVCVPKLDMLFGLSVRNNIVCWDLGIAEITMLLSGHLGRIKDMAVVPTNPPRLLTMDENAVFKMWEIAASYGMTCPCLSTFRVEKLSGHFPALCVLAAPQRLRDVKTEFWMAEQKHLASGGGAGGDDKEKELDAESPGAAIVGDLVVAAPRLHRVTTFPLELAEPPAAALYNEPMQCFVAVMPRDVLLWDADSGGSNALFVDVSVAVEITCSCFDDRKRKLYVGRQDGSVLTLNLQNGALMKQGHVHRGSVTAIIYNDEDRCLISAAADGSLAVYDDEPQGFLEDLRLVRRAHPRDITALAYSYEQSLVITGDREGCIRCWDFQDLKLMGDTWEHKSPVTALAPVGCYPFFLSCDSEGKMIMWTARGHTHPFQALYRFRSTHLVPEVYDPAAEGGGGGGDVGSEGGGDVVINDLDDEDADVELPLVQSGGASVRASRSGSRGALRTPGGKKPGTAGSSSAAAGGAGAGGVAGSATSGRGVTFSPKGHGHGSDAAVTTARPGSAISAFNLNTLAPAAAGGAGSSMATSAMGPASARTAASAEAAAAGGAGGPGLGRPGSGLSIVARAVSASSSASSGTAGTAGTGSPGGHAMTAGGAAAAVAAIQGATAADLVKNKLNRLAVKAQAVRHSKVAATILQGSSRRKGFTSAAEADEILSNLNRNMRMAVLVEQIVDDYAQKHAAAAGDFDPYDFHRQRNRKYKLSLTLEEEEEPTVNPAGIVLPPPPKGKKLDAAMREWRARLRLRHRTVPVAVTSMRVVLPSHEDVREAKLAARRKAEEEATAAAAAARAGSAASDSTSVLGAAAPVQEVLLHNRRNRADPEERLPETDVLLVTTDDRGRVRIARLSALLARTGVPPMQAYRWPVNHHAYSPRRRTHRDDPGPVITDELWFFTDSTGQRTVEGGGLTSAEADLMLDLERVVRGQRARARLGLTAGPAMRVLQDGEGGSDADADGDEEGGGGGAGGTGGRRSRSKSTGRAGATPKGKGKEAGSATARSGSRGATARPGSKGATARGTGTLQAGRPGSSASTPGGAVAVAGGAGSGSGSGRAPGTPAAAAAAAAGKGKAPRGRRASRSKWRGQGHGRSGSGSGSGSGSAASHSGSGSESGPHSGSASEGDGSGSADDGDGAGAMAAPKPKAKAKTKSESEGVTSSGATGSAPAIGMTIPLKGHSGVGIATAIKRRSALSGPIMKRAAIMAGVPEAADRDAEAAFFLRARRGSLAMQESLLASLGGKMGAAGPAGSVAALLKIKKSGRRRQLEELKPQPGDIADLSFWTAHPASIASINIFRLERVRRDVPEVEVPPKAGPFKDSRGEVPSLHGYFATTCGTDGRIYLWGLEDGRRVGELGNIPQDEDAIAAGIMMKVPWRFPAQDKAVQGEKDVEARGVLEHVAAAKEAELAAAREAELRREYEEQVAAAAAAALAAGPAADAEPEVPVGDAAAAAAAGAGEPALGADLMALLQRPKSPSRGSSPIPIPGARPQSGYQVRAEGGSRPSSPLKGSGSGSGGEGDQSKFFLTAVPGAGGSDASPAGSRAASPPPRGTGTGAGAEGDSDSAAAAPGGSRPASSSAASRAASRGTGAAADAAAAVDAVDAGAPASAAAAESGSAVDARPSLAASEGGDSKGGDLAGGAGPATVASSTGRSALGMQFLNAAAEANKSRSTLRRLSQANTTSTFIAMVLSQTGAAMEKARREAVEAGGELGDDLRGGIMVPPDKLVIGDDAAMLQQLEIYDDGDALEQHDGDAGDGPSNSLMGKRRPATVSSFNPSQSALTPASVNLVLSAKAPATLAATTLSDAAVAVLAMAGFEPTGVPAAKALSRLAPKLSTRLRGTLSDALEVAEDALRPDDELEDPNSEAAKKRAERRKKLPQALSGFAAGPVCGAATPLSTAAALKLAAAANSSAHASEPAAELSRVGASYSHLAEAAAARQRTTLAASRAKREEAALADLEAKMAATEAAAASTAAVGGGGSGSRSGSGTGRIGTAGSGSASARMGMGIAASGSRRSLSLLPLSSGIGGGGAGAGSLGTLAVPGSPSRGGSFSLGPTDGPAGAGEGGIMSLALQPQFSPGPLRSAGGGDDGGGHAGGAGGATGSFGVSTPRAAALGAGAHAGAGAGAGASLPVGKGKAPRASGAGAAPALGGAGGASRPLLAPLPLHSSATSSGAAGSASPAGKGTGPSKGPLAAAAHKIAAVDDILRMADALAKDKDRDRRGGGARAGAGGAGSVADGASVGFRDDESVGGGSIASSAGRGSLSAAGGAGAGAEGGGPPAPAPYHSARRNSIQAIGALLAADRDEDAAAKAAAAETAAARASYRDALLTATTATASGRTGRPGRDPASARADAMDGDAADMPLPGPGVFMPTMFGSYNALEVVKARDIFSEADPHRTGDAPVEALRRHPFWERMYAPHRADAVRRAIGERVDKVLSLREFMALVFPGVSRAMVEMMVKWTDPAVAAAQAEDIEWRKVLPAEVVEELTAVFEALDADNSGAVSIAEIKEALSKNQQRTQLESGWSMREIEDIINAYDENGNAELDLTEFLQLMAEAYISTSKVNMR